MRPTRRKKGPPKRAKWPPPKASKPTMLTGAPLQDAGRKCPHLISTAVHEGAHIVASRYFGRPIKTVTLQDEVGMGCMQLWPVASDATLIRQSLVMLGAGAAATRHYDRERDDGSGDAKQMQSEARRLVGFLTPQSAVDKEINTARRRADNLVRSRWSEILAVAMQLLIFHTLVDEVPAGLLEDLDQ